MAESTDLAILTSNLQQVQHKVMNQWTGKSLDQFLEQHHITHEQWLRQATDQIDEIKGQLDQLQKTSVENKKAITVQKRRADELRLAIEETSSKKQKLLFEKEQTVKEIQVKATEVKDEKELLDAQQKATRLRLDELNKAEDFFNERMGLKFKKLDSDNLQFVFTNIDPKDHDKVFYFTIKVLGKEYQVTDCCPTIEGMADYLEKLNKTNNLMEFVVSVRQKFKLAT